MNRNEKQTDLPAHRWYENQMQPHWAEPLPRSQSGAAGIDDGPIIHPMPPGGWPVIAMVANVDIESPTITSTANDDDPPLVIYGTSDDDPGTKSRSNRKHPLPSLAKLPK